jgi:DNA-binding NarL/FixJ family response regulator
VQNIRVIIVDDHAMVRDGLSKLLNLEPDIECVATAGDGEQAVKLTKEFLPDIVIVDLAMPGMSGIEVAEQIKNTRRSTKVLIISAYKYNYQILACMKVGVDGYLLKDTSSDELSNALRMIHAGNTVFNVQVTDRIQKGILAGSIGSNGATINLGERKIEVLRLAARGLGNKEIGHILRISTRTVGSHLAEIFKKMGVATRTEAILQALRDGLIDINDVVVDKNQSDG